MDVKRAMSLDKVLHIAMPSLYGGVEAVANLLCRSSNVQPANQASNHYLNRSLFALLTLKRLNLDPILPVIFHPVYFQFFLRVEPTYD